MGRAPSIKPVPVLCVLNLQYALFILSRVREADTDTVSSFTNQRSVTFADVTPTKLSAGQTCSKMLTNTSTEDELVSKKGNVSSFGSCSVLRFTARSSYKRYRPVCCSFTACSKRVCRWNTVTYMLHVIL
ncbi:hypothetical protein LDENG_00255500 [Lucifuga dentata]|nr:hypothetical protein LDENG_00255500 [Lucifuga dentata]